MKKIFMLIASAFLLTNVSAANVEKIQFANAGDFALGLMVGTPSSYRNCVDSRAKMPFISVDAMWGLKDGFCHTNKFGDNGAVDLGAYLGFCYFGDHDFHDWRLPIAVRSGFNWEFVKNLDVYSGFQAGATIFHNSYEDFGIKVSDGGAEGIFGMYLGAKWMFSDSFGVKAEFSEDWIGWSLPWFAAGVQFKF